MLRTFRQLREVDQSGMPGQLFNCLSLFLLAKSKGATDRPAHGGIRIEEQLGIGHYDTFDVVEEIVHLFSLR